MTKQSQMKTVKEHYFITEEDMDNLERLSERSEYWMKAYLFLNAALNANNDIITDPQKAWLEDILEEIQR